MKPVILFFLLSAAVHAAGLDATAWRFEQPVTVTAPGLTRLDLPVETINASQPELHDVRLLSPSGVETPLVIETTSLVPPRGEGVKDFKASAGDGETVLLLETGATEAIHGVILETPAPEFIKSVRVESGADGAQWSELVAGAVVFRQRDGAARLRVPVPSGVYARLRITLDDKRAQPVPFTAARVDFTKQKPVTAPHAISITKTEQKAKETVLTLDLGAANLNVASLTLQVNDPVFNRRVYLTYVQDDHGAPRTVSGVNDVLCRLPEKDGLKAESLELPVAWQIPVRQATLTIVNGDSPPLQVTGITAARQPVALVFFAPEAGAWRLLTGHRTAARPGYDVTALDAELRKSPASGAQAGGLAPNPTFKEPAALPGVPAEGSGIDLAKWRFRKAVSGAAAGVIRVELDEEVLSSCQDGLGDIRLVQKDRQIPWLRAESRAVRTIKPGVSRESDPKRPRVSLWKLTQPHAGLPVRELTCTSPTPLFDRTVSLWGNQKDEFGNVHRTQFGFAQWVRRTAGEPAIFSLQLGSYARVQGELFLETENGDNPPIEIADVKLLTPVQTLVAKVTDSAPVFLYYGNEHTQEPSYDLQLVRQELLAATPAPATLGAEEVLRGRKSGADASAGSPWLWGALGLVVAVLLWVVAKMLPSNLKPEA